MPLHDHFRPPILDELPYDTLHSSWGSEIARSLNRKWLRRPFRALEHRHAGSHTEIDVGTFEASNQPVVASSNGGGVATVTQPWTVPAAVGSHPLLFPETFEVRVYAGPSGWTLVAAIELISPGNQDRPGAREAFVSQCAHYLHAGVSVVLIDVVTEHHFNLHNELLDRLGISGDTRLPNEVYLYAAAYRPVQRGDRSEVDVWRQECKIGEVLPTMPMRLTGDLFVPIEFEATYREACESHWL